MFNQPRKFMIENACFRKNHEKQFFCLNLLKNIFSIFAKSQLCNFIVRYVLLHNTNINVAIANCIHF